MQPTDEEGELLFQLRSERAVAKFQGSVFADSDPGSLSCSREIAGAPSAIRQHQVTMQHHAQLSVAVPAGEGGARGEQKRFRILVGFHLTIPATKELDGDPTGVNDCAVITDAGRCAILSDQLKRLIGLELNQLFP